MGVRAEKVEVRIGTIVVCEAKITDAQRIAAAIRQVVSRPEIYEGILTRSTTPEPSAGKGAARTTAAPTDVSDSIHERMTQAVNVCVSRSRA